MKKFYQKHKTGFSRFGSLLPRNPVLERGLVLAPVVVLGTNLKAGAAMSIAFAVITFTTVLFANLLPKVIPYAVRALVNVLAAAGMFIPASMLLDWWMPGIIVKLGIFFPLLVVNSLIVHKNETYFRPMKKGWMIIDLLCHVIGFAMILLLVSLVREYFGAGTIWGIPMDNATLPALTLPFSGFLICGFLAAMVQCLRLYLGDDDQ